MKREEIAKKKEWFAYRIHFTMTVPNDMIVSHVVRVVGVVSPSTRFPVERTLATIYGALLFRGDAHEKCFMPSYHGLDASDDWMNITPVTIHRVSHCSPMTDVEYAEWNRSKVTKMETTMTKSQGWRGGISQQYGGLGWFL